MILSGYKTARLLSCWKALDHTMRYFYHKPHVPIIFLRQKVKETEICAHHTKGDKKITDIKNIREDTGSVTSVFHKYNQVIFAWKIAK